jgi:serine protease Do
MRLAGRPRRPTTRSPFGSHFAIGALLLLVLAGGSDARAQAREGSATAATTLSRALEELSARTAPSVVQIAVSAYTVGRSAGLPGLEQRGGSGVIVSADGWIVTNAHVVEGARRLEVVLPPAASTRPGGSIVRPSGPRFSARLAGLDRETDLALLKIEATGLPALAFGDSDRLRPGQLVLALGSPLGLDNTVTLGVVSAVGRQLKPEDRMVYIQTDASINPGNSGGALVDAEGRLVGINTLIFSQSGGSEGIGFAAPANIVRHVVEELKARGRVRRGEIGLTAQTITPALAAGLGLDRETGALVADVAPGGPAARAGIAAGDVLLRVNGKPMENGRQVHVNLYRAPVGESVTIDLLRRGTPLTVTVPVLERADDPDRLADLVDPERNLVPELGIVGVDIDERIAGYLPWLREIRGVLVAARAADAPAGEEGPLEAGDVVLTLNQMSLRGLVDLREALAARAPGAAVVLQVNRRGGLQYLSFPLP